eukprot:5950588-Ditylum_brightwellii.AAC.1
MTKFADDTNFTEENLGPNNAKEQFDQLGLNLVEEYGKCGDSPLEQWADFQLAHLELQLSVDARASKEEEKTENEKEQRLTEEEHLRMLT